MRRVSNVRLERPPRAVEKAFPDDAGNSGGGITSEPRDSFSLHHQCSDTNSAGKKDSSGVRVFSRSELLLGLRENECNEVRFTDGLLSVQVFNQTICEGQQFLASASVGFHRRV